MKKLLSFVFSMMIMLWAAQSFAQCTPDAGLTDPEGDGAMAPDTLMAWENVAMSTTLTIICPTTADVGGGSIPIHHITIKSITNKPGWMSYACNPGTCEYQAGINQCALVTGTPPSGSADTIYMDVLVDVFMNLSGTPVLAATDYNSGQQLVLIIYPPSAVEEWNGANFSLLSSTPNPFNNTTKIGCYSDVTQKMTLEVSDMLGKCVYSETINTQAGENFFSFDGSKLNDGLYFYSLINEQNQRLSRKMIKTR